MMNNLFSILIISSLLSLSSCSGESGLCSCGTSCKIGDSGTACTLDHAAFEKRTAELKKLFFDKATKIEETDSGYQFTFKDEGKLNKQLFDYILKEKECCSFFQFDLTILPFKEGIELRLSGGEEVKQFLKEMIGKTKS